MDGLRRPIEGGPVMLSESYEAYGMVMSGGGLIRTSSKGWARLRQHRSLVARLAVAVEEAPGSQVGVNEILGRS